jgi:dsRNA-specific ribonuclease
MELPNPLPTLPEIPELDIRRQVFAHSTSLTFSAAGPDTPPQSNERLEFLGDSYLNFSVTNVIFNRFPTLSPGELTIMRATIVSNANLNMWARAYRMHEYLVMGYSMAHIQAAERAEKLIANVFEAYIGGVLVSNPQGRQLIDDFFEALLQPVLNKRKQHLEGVSKIDKMSVSRLYETASMRRKKVEFKFGDSGVHGAEDRWEAICEWDGQVLGRAKARNQQDAKQRVSALVLQTLVDGN